MNRFINTPYTHKYSSDNLEKFVKHRSDKRLGLPDHKAPYRQYYHLNTKHGIMLLNHECFHEKFNRMIVKSKLYA